MKENIMTQLKFERSYYGFALQHVSIQAHTKIARPLLGSMARNTALESKVLYPIMPAFTKILQTFDSSLSI